MARRALILANGRFSDEKIAPLASPLLDAHRLSELLSREEVGGYEVHSCVDVDLLTARRQVQRFFDGSEYGDVVVMVISGHGIKDRAGKLHFATIDTELSSLNATSLDARFIIDCLDESAASKKILLVDTCFSGAFVKDMTATKSAMISITRDDFGDDASTGKAIITASTSIELAHEAIIESRAESVFTRHVIEGIETGQADDRGAGQISIDDLYRYVCLQIKAGQHGQTPQPFYFGIDGSTVIALNPLRQPRNIFDFSDVLNHRILEDIMTLTVPRSARSHLDDICVFLEDFLASAKVAPRYRHSTGWVACEMLSNYFSYAPPSPVDSATLKVQAARGGIVVSVTQADDPDFDLEAILAAPSKSESFMQTMERNGHNWQSRRHDGLLEVELHFSVRQFKDRESEEIVELQIRFEADHTYFQDDSLGLSCRLYRDNQAVVCGLEGWGDESNYLALMDWLERAVDVCRADDLRLVVLDMKLLEYLPSRGLRALTIARRNAGLYDIDVMLARPSERLSEVLSISKYDKLFKILSCPNDNDDSCTS